MFNRKYKKGMADAAKAYEAFGKKQEDAINRILEEVREQGGDFAEAIKNLNVNIDGLYDYLQSKEKAQLYTVYTPFDIKDLGKEEQLFLIGALFRLTTDKAPNEHQQDYLRSIQRYLDIKEPPFGTDPLAIENIEDIPAQKAILQAVMEYLYLQDGDSYDETELQQEFLDAFSVNNKGRQAIFKQVERLYKATGARGLAEKYGYVPTIDVESTSEVDIADFKNKEMTADDAATLYNLGFYSEHFDCRLENVREFLETQNYIVLLKYNSSTKTAIVQIVSKANGRETSIKECDKLLDKVSWWGKMVVSGDIVFATSQIQEYVLLCIDIPKRKYYSLFKSESKFELLAAEEEKALILLESKDAVEVHTNGEINQYGKIGINISNHVFFYNHEIWSLANYEREVLRYSVENKKMVSILARQNDSDFDGYIDPLIYGDNLYIVLRKRSEDILNYSYTSLFRIVSVNLKKPKDFRIICDNVTAYSCTDVSFSKGPNGWLFIGEKRKGALEFGLYFFSCKTEQITLLTKGCGTYVTTPHIFKEDEIHPYPSRFRAIGDFAFFSIKNPRGSDVNTALVSIRDPKVTKAI